MNLFSRNVLRCPECRAEHPVPAAGVSGFPTNITLQRLLEANTLPNVPSPTVRNRPANHVGQRSGVITNSYNRNASRNADDNRSATTLSVLSPTAPPLGRHVTQRQQAYDVDFQLALQISAEEERRSRENQLNRNVGAEDGSRRVENGQNTATNAGHDSRRRLANQENEMIFFNNIRQYIRHVADQILNNHKTMLAVFIYIYIHVTFSRFVAGAVKLSSDCDLERRTAVYLFVKSILAALFWGALGLWICKGMLEKALDNRFVEFYLVLESLFSIIWLFVGTAWICGNFNNIYSQCPAYSTNWNGHYINFALFLTVIDYIGLVVFLFYSGYIICENEEES